MTNYTGLPCPVCNKLFKNDDDIVVCPVCGAPHHRACYGIENKCAFVDSHATGKVWQPPQPKPLLSDKQVPYVTCRICGCKNAASNLYCISCGHRLTSSAAEAPLRENDFLSTNPTALLYGGMLPTEEIGEFSAWEVSAFVGRSAPYYLGQFKQIANNGGKYKLNFNFSAFFFGFFYFFYRKMYKLGAFFMAISLLLSVPQLLRMKQVMPDFEDLQYQSVQDTIAVYNKMLTPTQDTPETHKYRVWEQIAGNLNLVFHIFIGLFANYFYYLYTMRKLKQLKHPKQGKGVRYESALQYEMHLYQQGGVSGGGVGAAIAILFAVSMLLGVVFLI